jgi:hypothetical protein
MKELITSYQNKDTQKSEYLDKISNYHKILYQYSKLVKNGLSNLDIVQMMYCLNYRKSVMNAIR